MKTTQIGKFNVRIVNRGDAYGLNNCRMHDEDEPLIEFYDVRYPHTQYGQFVSRYYRSTLLEPPLGNGLRLDGGIPDWSISAAEFARVREFIMAERS